MQTTPFIVNGKEIIFSTFPNQETFLTRESTDLLEEIIRNNKDIKIDFKFFNNGDLINLLLLTNHISDQVASGDITLNVKYLPYSRMDRSESGSLFSLKYIVDFITHLPVHHFIVNELHSDVSKEMLDSNELITVYGKLTVNDVSVNLLKALKASFLISEDDVLFLPDKGANDRYLRDQSVDKIHSRILTGNKVRDFDSGKIKSVHITEEDAKNVSLEGRVVFMLDDLVSYGGTFNMASKRLMELGAVEVNLIVTHAENSIFKGELFNHVNTVYCTDSIISEIDDEYKDRVQLINMNILQKITLAPQKEFMAEIKKIKNEEEK